MTRRWCSVVGLAWLFSVNVGCGGQSQPDCIQPPCPLPIAITLNVTSAAGGAVPGLTLALSGATTGSGQCTAGAAATTCVVPGVAGTYNLQLAAPGFADKTLSVVVTGTTPACGCPAVVSQSLDVVMTPQ